MLYLAEAGLGMRDVDGMMVWEFDMCIKRLNERNKKRSKG